MRDDKRFPVYDEHDTTVADLLGHLQQLRRSVPVNYQLKAELKQKLLQRMKDREEFELHTLTPTEKKRRLVWWLWSGAVALSLAAALGIWNCHSLFIQRGAVLTIPAPSSVDMVDIRPDGSSLAYLSTDANIHMISLEKGSKSVIIDLPSGSGTYQSLAWAHNSRQLAIVEQADSLSRLWLVEVAQPGVSSSMRLLKEEKHVQFHSPAWSPGDDQVVFTKRVNGKEELWVCSTVSFQERKLTEGGQPSWSPDGQRIAFVKEGIVSILDLRSKSVTPFGPGGWPSWRHEARVTYTQDGKLLEARLHEQPPVTTELAVKRMSAEKLLRANWAANQEHLLLAQQADPEQGVVFSVAR